MTEFTSNNFQMTGVLSDAVFHSKLLAWMRELPDSMVIDPYVTPEDVEAMARFATNVSRVLTRRRSSGDSGPEMTPVREQELAQAASTGRIEIRVLAKRPGKQLHDRLVLPATGEGLMFGTSLYAHQLTVVTRLTEEVTAELRAHYEPIWDGARTPMEPFRTRA